MQVFVAGTWSSEKAVPFSQEGVLIGKEIAIRGYDLACGPGTGMAKHIIEGYRSIIPRGKVRFYLPKISEMEKVGEVIGEGADETIETDLDYPLRNIYQIRESDALFIITGGDGTLEEAIVALADYQLPVAALENSGSAVKALSLLLDIYPSWKTLLKINNNILDLMDHIDNLLGLPQI